MAVLLVKNNTNSKPPAPLKRKTTLQSAGKDMIESHSKTNTSMKVGASNPPPSEIPNIVYYNASAKEDIRDLNGPPVDPVKAHREMYAPRNMNMPVKRNTKTNTFDEEQKAIRKESIPKSKGYIAPKKEK